MTTATPPAGWYDDPDTAGKLRWWDGSDWTERRADAPPPGAGAPVSDASPASVTAVAPDREPTQPATDAPSRAAVRPADGVSPAGGFASPSHGLTSDVGAATTGVASSVDDSAPSVGDASDTGTWSVAPDATAEDAAEAPVPAAADAANDHPGAQVADRTARADDATGDSTDEDTGEWRIADVERAARGTVAEPRESADGRTGEPPIDEWRRSTLERSEDEPAVREPHAAAGGDGTAVRQPHAAAGGTAPTASRAPIEDDSDVLVWGTPPVRDEQMTELASPWSRLAAYLLDTALSFVAFIVLGVVTALLGVLPDGLASVVGLVLTIGTWALLFVLYVMGTGRLGQSYGKHLMGISVVSTRTGRPIGSPAAFGRGIVQTIGIYVFFLGVLWILWDPQRQGWHDKAVGSVVVEDPAATRMDPLAFLRAILATR